MNIDGSETFPNLSSFCLKLLCLPHSSATVERVFSTVNRMKTKSRNRLNAETLSGLLYTQAYIHRDNCYDFFKTKQMLTNCDSSIYN